jgi:cell division protein ZapE
LLQRHVEVTTLDSPTDYRLEKLESLPVYVAPLGPEADRLIDRAWKRMTEGRPEVPTEIEMKGRVVPVPRAVGRVARFTFGDLCERPLGASDYLEIAKRFDVVFVDHIPHLGPAKRNETKRFIILVDALYDASVRLLHRLRPCPRRFSRRKREPKVSNSIGPYRGFSRCAARTIWRITPANARICDASASICLTFT